MRARIYAVKLTKKIAKVRSVSQYSYKNQSAQGGYMKKEKTEMFIQNVTVIRKEEIDFPKMEIVKLQLIRYISPIEE